MELDTAKLAKKAQAWNDNEDREIQQAIKDSAEALKKLNRGQLLKSKDSKDRALTHKSTGKTTLTPAYAKKTGKRKPNLLLEGKFQQSIFLTVGIKEHSFGATNFKTPFLVNNYGLDLFGVAPSNENKESVIVSRNYLNNYINKVWRI